ncbi:MAG TPA: prolyl oligopeptidase family serine peptidase, partial [Thermoanaerobaculia bacterium]|nr:prolyl oligopeptidase family serine peptidase [Thermoanaerobaculia bacterium]
MVRQFSSIAVGILISTLGVAAQEYQRPPEVLAQLVDATLTPAVSISPDESTLLLMDRPSLPPISELAEPELRLAGLRINPRTSGPSRSASFNGLRLVDVASARERAVSDLPSAPRIRNASWSPDSRHVAFTIDTPTAVELWILSKTDASARRLGTRAVNQALSGRAFYWLDANALIARLVPGDRGEAPEDSGVPAGPVIQENIGRTAPARTYQDLLQNPHDERLFDHYATSRLATITLDGSTTEIGAPSVIAGFEPSADGRFILLQHLQRPYSYLVPQFRFPRKVEIVDRTGRSIKVIAENPLQEEIPLGFGSVPTDRRSFEWRADQPATLLWVEALDGGDARKEAEWRDRLFTLSEPFDGPPKTLATLPLRFNSVYWGDDDLALVSEGWWTNRKARLYAVDPSRPGTGMKTVFDYSFEDRYNAPGTPLTAANRFGRDTLVLEADNAFYLTGEGGSAEGDRPFLRRYDWQKATTSELFRSSAPHYERPLGFLDATRRQVLTLRESADEPPNYFARDLRRGRVRALTSFPHPYPELKGVKKELIMYPRADGVMLSATLYLPAGYDSKKDGPLPALVWAYPNEFKSADAASQVQDSPHRFKRVSYWGAVPWVTRGYAILDDAAMPIIGEGDVEPNDSFVEQLVMGAKAVIDEGVRRGVVDPDRVAVGGHSYGAFMTGNLLAHSDLFRAGIARSGAYNRSLTPFGFQSEERTYWEAPEVY